jgi:hypothetical protein
MSLSWRFKPYGQTFPPMYVHGEPKRPHVASKIAGPAECSCIEKVLLGRNRRRVDFRSEQVGCLKVTFQSHLLRSLSQPTRRYCQFSLSEHFLGAYSRLQGGFAILAPKLDSCQTSCIEVSLLFGGFVTHTKHWQLERVTLLAFTGGAEPFSSMVTK